MLGGHEAPPWKSIMFGVTDTIGTVESGNLSRSCMTGESGGLEERDLTSGGFSTLDAIAKKRNENKDEDCLSVRQVMVWFEFHQ